ncbi:PadR family transcriptional regulator [Actinoplanes hulinensis]|uniref:PadR family transcriptional regulator n=1 Tax=Actinoplanes hulinensis TaxID=1144547 RepID=A0ABS7B7Y2_9ACTN|nr:PadR family transcriptional regulator [Actinoplanes hulinensis]
MRRGTVPDLVLTALLDGPAHGYELMDRLERFSGGGWRPGPGSIYPLLQMFQDTGLVSSSETDWPQGLRSDRRRPGTGGGAAGRRVRGRLPERSAGAFPIADRDAPTAGRSPAGVRHRLPGNRRPGRRHREERPPGPLSPAGGAVTRSWTPVSRCRVPAEQ